MGGLSTILDRKVVDRTGLTGRYDVTAGVDAGTWTTEARRRRPGHGPRSTNSSA